MARRDRGMEGRGLEPELGSGGLVLDALLAGRPAHPVWRLADAGPRPNPGADGSAAACMARHGDWRGCPRSARRPADWVRVARLGCRRRVADRVRYRRPDPVVG